MSRLALYLLGPPHLERNGEPIHISRRKAVAMLAYLAMTGRSRSRDVLATLLWPEFNQSRASAEAAPHPFGAQPNPGGGMVDR